MIVFFCLTITIPTSILISFVICLFKGPLRFIAPRPADPWTGIRDASQFSRVCPQLSDGVFPQRLPTGEDCLYLNVYSPKVGRPVLIAYFGYSTLSDPVGHHRPT